MAVILRGIQRQAAHVQHRCHVARRPSHQCAHERGQLTGLEELGEIVVGAGFDAFDLLGPEANFNARGTAPLDNLRKVSSDVGAHPAQVSLAWLMTRRGLTAPIASATTVEFDDILAAVEARLPKEAMEMLEQAER